MTNFRGTTILFLLVLLFPTEARTCSEHVYSLSIMQVLGEHNWIMIKFFAWYWDDHATTCLIKVSRVTVVLFAPFKGEGVGEDQLFPFKFLLVGGRWDEDDPS